MFAEITTNDKIIFDGAQERGFVKSLKHSGHEASPSTNPDYKATYYTSMDPALPSRRHVFAGPVYLSCSPSEHYVNPDFIEFIEQVSA